MDKEKIVRDLVNTFNDRDELHIAYKDSTKKMLIVFFHQLLIGLEEDDFDPFKFIDTFVEETFKTHD